MTWLREKKTALQVAYATFGMIQCGMYNAMLLTAGDILKH